MLSFAFTAPGVSHELAYMGGMVFVGLVVIIGIAALTRQHQRPYSATVFYLLLGVLASFLLGAAGVGRLQPTGAHVLFEHLTELALAVAVFGAGLAIERPESRYSVRLVALLLVVVMPLTILAIAGFGMVAMGLPFGAALLLGAVLAPTDPVLAGDLGLGAPGATEQREPRFSLHTEAAANDGLASPFVLLGLFIATSGHHHWLGTWVLEDLLYGVLVAVLLGYAVGRLAAFLSAHAHARELFSPRLDGLLAPALAVIIYGAGQAIGTYGLIAAFVAGIAFRRHNRTDALDVRLYHAAELSGRLLEMVILLLLGAGLTTSALALPGLGGWLLAPLVIFIIRPVLVHLVTHRGELQHHGRRFLAFFGVRGVAAIYYCTVVFNSRALDPAQSSRLVWTTVACVGVSVIVHGVSATPLARRWLE